MGKQRLQNQIRKLDKLQDKRLDDVLSKMIKDYIVYGKSITNQKAIKIADKIKNMLIRQKEHKIVPNMPSESWMKENGTMCEPLDYQGE